MIKISKLKELRESYRLDKKGISLTELSYITGIKYSTLYAIEKGRSYPGYKTAQKLMKFFNCNLADLVD